MKEKAKRYFRRFIIAAVLFVFLILPLCLYTVLRLGFPPVVGNLLSARAMTSYAAQVHPDWTPENGWAGYNLVDGNYWLSFSDGSRPYSLGYANGMVRDEVREEAMREELEIDKALRVNGLWRPNRYTYWYARWPVRTPDQVRVTVDVTFYDGADIPVPDEAAMREKMADEAIRAYETLSLVTPIQSFSVQYCHDRIAHEHNGNVWNIIRTELPEGTVLTREAVLSGELIVK